LARSSITKTRNRTTIPAFLLNQNEPIQTKSERQTEKLSRAHSLFGLILANRVVHFEFITHIIILNLVSMACVSFLLKKKVIALVIGVIVILVSPVYYFNAYTNIKNNAPENFQTLTDGIQTFKFFSESETGNFILIEKTENNYLCYGPYETNSTECQRLGSMLFK